MMVLKQVITTMLHVFNKVEENMNIIERERENLKRPKGNFQR
jgi:hypothetical protein